MNRFYTVLIFSLRSIGVILFWLVSSTIVQAQAQPSSIEALNKKREALMLQMEKEATDRMTSEVSKLLQKRTTSRVATNTITLAAATQSEHDALVAFYNSTGGPSWTNNTNWLSTQPINQWYGVQVDADDHVIGLSLSNNNLIGPIPSQIGDLSWLRFLYLQDNGLNGSLPIELGMLSELRIMFLYYNSFSGTIPSELGNLQQLQYLWLFTKNSPPYTKLTGVIPSSLGNLLALQSFAVGSNALTGPLPASMGNLQNLTFLGIESNAINDSIPDEWMQMSNLETIQAYNAELTGDIPAGLTNLLNLKNVTFMGNHLRGHIPSQLNNLTLLEDFTVIFNRFTFSDILDAKRNFAGNYFGYNGQDSVDTRKNTPASVGNSLTLSASVDRNTSPSCLYQWFKYVNGTNDIPVTPTASVGYHTQIIQNITSADHNTKYYYKITHPEAPDLTLISRLQTVVVNNNGTCTSTLAQEYDALMTFYQSTGGAGWTNNTGWRDANPNVVQSVNGWFGVSTDANGYVVSLSLEGNNLDGYIPQEIGDFCKLQSLQLYTNLLRDSIPRTIGKLSELRGLTLINNQLSGPIPVEIGNLTKIQSIYLHNNLLTGSIPSEIGNLTELTFLGLSNNRLTDSIPGSLGNLNKLYALQLFNNQLSGEIPKRLGNLVNLIDLNLYANQLTGSIPEELGNCSSLQYLSLLHNQLTDSIPKSLGNLVHLRGLALNSNQLIGTIPPELGNLSQLTGLNLSVNKLTGTIPQSLGNLENLRQLYLNSNLLTGTIPNQFSDLTRLQEFRIDFNFLSGSIPSVELINPQNYFIHINNNKFTFSDFLNAKQSFVGTGFLYSPQDSVDVRKNIQGAIGTPLTLTTSIDRNTNPASKYQWFKFVDGYSDIPVTPLSTTSHTFVFQNPTESDDGSRYYYKIYNDSAVDLILTSRIQTLRIRPCTIAMNPRFSTKKYLCALNFVPTGTSNNLCTAIHYFWDFGDGGTSSIKSPVHAYGAAGTYSVSLRFTFQCGSCQKDTTITRAVSFNPAEEILMDSLIQVPTTIKKQVISASVATFSDSWPLQHHANLTSRNSFISGSEGVWRNDAAFVYDVPRQVSDSSIARISSDGTFNMEQFNWEYADLNAVPNWIKANTMTEYSPFSYELENRDVLGIYSAALYDYGGHLPSANGVNMRNAEMAFTSFEFLDGNVTGNWLFGNKPAPAQSVYKVQSGKNFMAIVEVSMDKLDGVTQVDISTQGRSISFTSKSTKLNKDVKIVCLQEHPLNPKWTIVVFERSMGSLAWSGKLIVKNPITPTATPDIDNTIAHSGESSLRIAVEKTFRQDLLQLEVGKRYWISGWVSINNPSVAIPKLADGLGIDVVFRDKTNQVIGTSVFEPSGRIIEGWQQVKGSFQCIAADAIVELKFRPGTSGTAWYDDVRLHPEKGNMKSYVYDLKDYRLQAILDEENFASFFYYDKEGNLYLTKKETEEGIKTLTENVSYQIESGN